MIRDPSRGGSTSILETLFEVSPVPRSPQIVALDAVNRRGPILTEIRRWLGEQSVTRVGPRWRQEVVPVEQLETVSVVHKTSRAGDPHRHIHFQNGTRVWAAGAWRGLDTAALFKQQGAVRALGTAVIAAHPQLAAVLEVHGLTLDPVTGEVAELEPFNAHNLGDESRRDRGQPSGRASGDAQASRASSPASSSRSLRTVRDRSGRSGLATTDW